MDFNNSGFIWGFSGRESPEDDAPLMPFFECYEERLNSFKFWPDDKKKKALAKLGFYFAPHGFFPMKGKIICHSCGSGTSIEYIAFGGNIYHHNHCRFMNNLLLQNINWVNNTRKREVITHVSDEEFEKFKRQNWEKIRGERNKLINKLYYFFAYYFKKLLHFIFVYPKFSRNCIICRDAPSEVKFIPCGDITHCIACGKQTSHCPTCRKPYTGLIRCYLYNDKHNGKNLNIVKWTSSPT